MLVILCASNTLTPHYIIMDKGLFSKFVSGMNTMGGLQKVHVHVGKMFFLFVLFWGGGGGGGGQISPFQPIFQIPLCLRRAWDLITLSQSMQTTRDKLSNAGSSP